MAIQFNNPVAERFDKVAASWDANPVRVALARGVAEAICRHVPMSPALDAMDFGAGTGLLTLALSPRLRRITALDTSREMLKVLEEKRQAAAISNLDTLLCDPTVTPLPPARFDLVVSSMALHHVANPTLLLGKLRAALKPGGWLAMADLDSEDGSFHPDRQGVFHNGFDRRELCAILERCGFVNAASHDAHTIVRPGPDGRPRNYSVFLAVARVP